LKRGENGNSAGGPLEQTPHDETARLRETTEEGHLVEMNSGSAVFYNTR